MQKHRIYANFCPYIFVENFYLHQNDRDKRLQEYLISAL